VCVEIFPDKETEKKRKQEQEEFKYVHHTLLVLEQLFEAA